MPLQGSIDLMKYYLGEGDSHRIKSSEYDIKSLIWISQLRFGE